MNYNDIRRKTKEIKIGNIAIGGNNPIAIQSMLNTKGNDYNLCYKQTKSLIDNGCDIVRMAITDKDSLSTLYKLKCAFPNCNFVSDIQFDYRMAIDSVDAGVDKVRINPGNIGDIYKVRQVINKCNSKNIPIRIGVNSGSLEKDILEKYSQPSAEALFESACKNVEILRQNDFDNIVVSIKSTNPYTTFFANKMFSEKYDYPVHIGVTESGFGQDGLLKSTSCVSSLLFNGIGDTLRISLTDNPVKEIDAANEILKAIGITNKPTINYISCPTCGRTEIDLIRIADAVKERLSNIKNLKRNITVAIMGCVVNGPGEAREAEIGIAGGKHCAMLFSHGEIIKKINEDEIVECVEEEVLKYCD